MHREHEPFAEGNELPHLGPVLDRRERAAESAGNEFGREQAETALPRNVGVVAAVVEEPDFLAHHRRAAEAGRVRMLFADEGKLVDAALAHAKHAHAGLICQLDRRLQPIVQPYDADAFAGGVVRLVLFRRAVAESVETLGRILLVLEVRREPQPIRPKRIVLVDELVVLVDVLRLADDDAPLLVERRKPEETKRGKDTGDLVVSDVGREDVLDDLLLVEKEHDRERAVGVALVRVGQDLGEWNVAALERARARRSEHRLHDEHSEQESRRERSHHHAFSMPAIIFDCNKLRRGFLAGATSGC